MESSCLEEENIIRDVRNLFKLKKQRHGTAIKDIRSLLKSKKDNKVIKNRILRCIRNLFEHEEEENYYKPARVSNFWSNNYIEFESKDGRKETLAVEE